MDVFGNDVNRWCYYSTSNDFSSMGSVLSDVASMELSVNNSVISTNGRNHTRLAILSLSLE